MTDFVIVDLETTGLSAETDKIIEFGAVQVSCGIPVAVADILINPMCTIPLKITQITGITNSMVMTQPNIYEAWGTISRWFNNNAVLVGYNIDDFDIKFLNNVSLELNGSKITNKTYDVLPIMRKKYPKGTNGIRSHSLTDICNAFNIKYDAHRASNDCMALYELMMATGLIEKYIR